MVNYTIAQIESKLDEFYEEKSKFESAIGGIDYIMGCQTEYTEWFEESKPNMDGVFRLVLNVEVPSDLEIESLDDHRGYVLHRLNGIERDIATIEGVLLNRLRESRRKVLKAIDEVMSTEDGVTCEESLNKILDAHHEDECN